MSGGFAPSAYTLGWIIWFLIFAVIEGKALANSRDNDTLSEHVWAFAGLNVRRGDRDLRSPTGWTRFRRFLVLTLCCWLLAHFTTGGIF